VLEWAWLHQQELQEAWEQLRKSKLPLPIAPLD